MKSHGRNKMNWYTHNKDPLRRCQGWFYRMGIVFFMVGALYFGMLLWKSYVWYNWLKSMENNLMRQQPPTTGPLINPHDYRLINEIPKLHDDTGEIVRIDFRK